MRMGTLPLILKTATDWAPYEHPRLAPKPEQPPAETDEERAFRLRSTMMEMRNTVGGPSAGEATTNGPQSVSADFAPLGAGVIRPGGV